MELNFLKQLFRYFILCMYLCWYCYCISADIKDIKLTLYQDKGEFKCWAQPLYLEVGDLYRIFVKTESYLHNEIRCHNYKIPLHLDKERNGYTTGSENASKPGDGELECLFYTKKCEVIIPASGRCRYNGIHEDAGVKCHIKIYVYNKGESYKAPHGNLTVNGASVTSDDGQYIHKFYEEEGATFQCHKTTGSKVKLVYISKASNVISTDFQTAASVSMYMRLNNTNDDATVLCVISDEEEKHLHKIRIRLKQHEDKRGQLNFEINGLLLPLINKMSEGEYITYNYEYNFYDGETVTVSIAKDDAMYGGITCLADGIEQLLNYFKGSFIEMVLLKFPVNKGDNGTSVFCHVKDPIWPKKEPIKINLMFLIQKPNYSPFIAGIPKSNILLQYTNNASNIIKYGITGNEILRLTCHTYNWDRPTMWIHYQSKIITSPEYTVPRTYQLCPEQNHAVIKCEVNSSTPEKNTCLELYRQKNEFSTLTTVISPTLDVTTTKSISTAIPNLSTTTTATSATYIPSDNENNMVLIISGGVVVVVIVLAFLLWVTIKKRKNMLQNKSSTMDYQNLPEHHEGPMATPAQWNRPDEATYADPNSLDHLYSKPVPKNQRKKPEPTYANPNGSKPTSLNTQHVSDEPTYASVQNDEPTYASVQNDEPTYASVQNNEPTYASVQNNEPTYASVQNYEPTYASVQNYEPTYASVQNYEPTYASVQNDESTYASIKYNEPTYANQNSLDYQNFSTLKTEAKNAKDEENVSQK